MLGTHPIEAILGTGIDNTNHEAVRATVRAAADKGLSVLFVWPNSKVPADLRSSRQKNADNKAAQDVARAAGVRAWDRVKSPAGLALATSHKLTLDKYLKAYIQQFSTWVSTAPEADDTPVSWSKKAEDAGEIVMLNPAAVNLAVEVGGSGVVIVDCDTVAQLHRWYQVATDTDNPDVDELPPCTVLSPGQVGPNGDPDDPSTWAHLGGGHFWFTVPEDIRPLLPRNIGALTWPGEDGFAVLWDRRYVLIPPSTRPEGAYEFLGTVEPLPQWLFEAITSVGENRAAYARQMRFGDDDRTELSDAIDEWAEQISWAQILEPYGWTPAPRADSCGCAVWTAPGSHASPKSATAHDVCCTLGRYTEANAPLHIWTDHDVAPFDEWLASKNTSTLSKLQAVALIDYAGNVGKAMDQLGLTPSHQVDDPNLDLGGMDADLPPSGGDGGFDLPSKIEVTYSDTEAVFPTTDVGIASRPRSPFAPTPPKPIIELTGEPQEMPGAPNYMQPKPIIELTGEPQEMPGAPNYMQPKPDQRPPSPFAPKLPKDPIVIPVADEAAAQGDIRAELRNYDPAANFTCQCGILVNPIMDEVVADDDGNYWHLAKDGSDHLCRAGVTETSTSLAAAPEQTPRSQVAGTEEPSDAELTAMAYEFEAEQAADALAADRATYTNDTGATTDPRRIDPADFGADPAPAPLPDPEQAPDDENDPNVFTSEYAGMPLIAPFDYWRGVEPPQYIVEDLIEHCGLSSIIGPPNVGKSTVTLDMLCHIAAGKRWQGRQTLKTRVLYLPGEGLSGAVERIQAWEDAHQMSMSHDLILGNGIVQVGALNEAWGELAAYIMRMGIGFVVFDTFARCTSGLEENSATDVSRAVKRFNSLQRLANVGVCVVHHTAKGNPASARGSSALNGALDSELVVREANWDTSPLRDANGRMENQAIEVWTSKQKNAEQLEHAIPLLITSHLTPGAPKSAALITGPNGSVDPMQGDIVVARPPAEPIVETAIRIRRHVDNLPEQGASRAELVVAIRPDAYAAQRADAGAYWKLRIGEAVDRALRYDLIKTLTGKPSGARYIPGGATLTQARAAAAAEALGSDTD